MLGNKIINKGNYSSPITIFYVLVVATCGGSVAENCTYFSSNGGESGRLWNNKKILL